MSDLEAWLERLELGQHAQVLAENDVDLDVLPHLSGKLAPGHPPLTAADMEFETVPNIVFKLLPSEVRAPIAATDTSAAIRPYSRCGRRFAKRRHRFPVI